MHDIHSNISRAAWRLTETTCTSLTDYCIHNIHPRTDAKHAQTHTCTHARVTPQRSRRRGPLSEAKAKPTAERGRWSIEALFPQESLGTVHDHPVQLCSPRQLEPSDADMPCRECGINFGSACGLTRASMHPGAGWSEANFNRGSDGKCTVCNKTFKGPL